MSFIRGTISRLKRRFPAKVDIYKTISRTHDVTTGTDIVVKDKVSISKAIVPPPQLRFQLVPAGVMEQIKYSGMLQSEVTTAIIDVRDLKGMILDIEDCHVIHKNQKYEISQVQDYNGEAVILTMKAIKGVPLEQIFDGVLQDVVSISEGYTNE